MRRRPPGLAAPPAGSPRAATPSRRAAQEESEGAAACMRLAEEKEEAACGSGTGEDKGERVDGIDLQTAVKEIRPHGAHHAVKGRVDSRSLTPHNASTHCSTFSIFRCYLVINIQSWNN